MKREGGIFYLTFYIHIWSGGIQFLFVMEMVECPFTNLEVVGLIPVAVMMQIICLLVKLL